MSANDGKVTLTGNVEFWDERALAGTAAWAAPGVTSVTNNIRVDRQRRMRRRPFGGPAAC